MEGFRVQLCGYSRPSSGRVHGTVGVAVVAMETLVSSKGSHGNLWKVYVGPGKGYGTEDVQMKESFYTQCVGICVDPFWCFCLDGASLSLLRLVPSVSVAITQWEIII